MCVIFLSAAVKILSCMSLVCHSFSHVVGFGAGLKLDFHKSWTAKTACN